MRQTVPPLTLADVPARADELAAMLDETAVARDQAGGHAAHERERIRDSGLLLLSIPREFGGLQAGWPVIYRTIRTLARADSALAHVYAFHHLQMTTLQLYAPPAMQARLFRDAVDERRFWGNALNPLDTGLVATPGDGGWVLDGVKGFASGSVGSDWMTVSAHVRVDEVAGKSGADGVGGGVAGGVASGRAPLLLIGAVPTKSPGITVREDWDAFGQRQTDSGSVKFERVPMRGEDVMVEPGRTLSVRASLRSQVAQMILTNLYLGIAQGAFESARRFTLEKSRPWFTSGLARSVDDPVVQHRYGQLRVLVWPAELAADHAAMQLQAALDAGDDVTAAQRGDVAVTAAQAKVLAHRAAIEVTNQMFELTGARSTSARFGMDRYWRNARVHTLHDPVDQKLRDIGRHAIEGVPPTPTSYS